MEENYAEGRGNPDMQSAPSSDHGEVNALQRVNLDPPSRPISGLAFVDPACQMEKASPPARQRCPTLRAAQQLAQEDPREEASRLLARAGQMMEAARNPIRRTAVACRADPSPSGHARSHAAGGYLRVPDDTAARLRG